MSSDMEFMILFPRLQLTAAAGGAALVLYLLYRIVLILYRTKFHTLKKIPGPWLPAATSLWIRWQRWHGRLSFRADDLLSRYGPIVRIAPNMVLCNDVQSVQTLFARQDLDTAPTAIRALRIADHDWTVTYPQNPIAKSRRRPVMLGSTTKAMRTWQPTFEDNITTMISDLAETQGAQSEDIVHHLRVATLRNSGVVMAGSETKLEPGDFPHIVGEYNFLVVWRLCMPTWMFEWLGNSWSPFSHAKFRVESDRHLFDLGKHLAQKGEENKDDENTPTIYRMLKDRQEKGFVWTETEIGAEMAGQILAATETTSSALAFIFYELAKNPALADAVYREVQSVEGYDNLDELKLLDACVTEGLRFRPPVALTGSRVIPEGGVKILGYDLPAGTVVTTQSLSLSRQRPDLFPNFNEFDPTRWLDEDKLQERRKCLAPFGVGARRCPGGNMATFQMRMILAAAIRAFNISVAPETTPESMEPFEANGFRSRYDECYLVFTPRELDPQPGPQGCECGTACDCVVCTCVHYTDTHH
ncbi:hypothetical protein N0V93_001960 [Gnomoniopsis smithogilvyi]|uniref:Cytochrome P450 n=1 Tax=Gnomoniopsis smithogilvyi TaxID=1191159 RepID=A0A9W8Z4P4_9PEZI|nr:hypothetical protein N0V93_001960 [Gnomoniopsis smithogilvyi]